MFPDVTRQKMCHNCIYSQKLVGIFISFDNTHFLNTHSILVTNRAQLMHVSCKRLSLSLDREKSYVIVQKQTCSKKEQKKLQQYNHFFVSRQNIKNIFKI